jgi:hypothetical protein
MSTGYVKAFHDMVNGSVYSQSKQIRSVLA